MKKVKVDGNIVIYEQDYVHALGIFEGSIIDNSLKQIPNEKFKWDEYSNFEAPEDVFRYLSLDDIWKQYKENMNGASPLLTVVYESSLDGVIYQYGNYSDGKWYKIGELRGYA